MNETIVMGIDNQIAALRGLAHSSEVTDKVAYEDRINDSSAETAGEEALVRTGLLVSFDFSCKIIIAGKVSLIRWVVKRRITRRRDKSVTVRAFGAGRS